MINFLKNNIYNLFYGYFRVKICWDLYLKIDNRQFIQIFTNIRFRSPNYQISILTWNSLYQATMLHPPPIFQLNLQPQTLKFICQDLITIPTRPSLWSHRRTIVTSAEIKKRYKHSRPPSLNICLANKLETKTWGEWLVEETDKDDRYRASHAPESSSRPSSTPIVAQSRFLFEIYLTLFNDVDSCGFFFYSNSNVSDRLD